MHLNFRTGTQYYVHISVYSHNLVFVVHLLEQVLLNTWSTFLHFIYSHSMFKTSLLFPPPDYWLLTATLRFWLWTLNNMFSPFLFSPSTLQTSSLFLTPLQSLTTAVCVQLFFKLTFPLLVMVMNALPSNILSCMLKGWNSITSLQSSLAWCMVAIGR